MQSKKSKTPKWWYTVRVKEFPPALKEVYNYFTWFDERACIQWNCRLAKKFNTSRRTICRRLERLKKLRLIWVTSGGGPHRRIHCHHYKDSTEWIKAMSIPRASLRSKKPVTWLSKDQAMNIAQRQRKALLINL